MKLRAELESRVQKIQEQIESAEEKRSQLLVRYTEEYPDVKAVDAQIAKLKETKDKAQAEGTKRIEEESKRTKKSAETQVLTVLKAKLDSALKSETQARSLYYSEIGVAGQQGQAAAKLTTLTNAIETSRNLLNTYTQRQKEMQLVMNSSRPDNISISSNAQRPGGPIGPNRNRNIIVAFLISLAAGIGLAFLFDYLDDSIKSSDDVGRHLGLPTLALIPHHNTIKKQKRSTALSTRSGNLASTALISLDDNRSAIAEAYRHLRTSLLFSSAGKPPQTILVTSSQPSEGKTTTAINIAITLAQSGAEVVIIDCDLRRPRLHSHFDLENTSGLTNYLSGDRNPDNLLKPYPGLPNLKVVTSGPIPPNPAELLSSNEMKNLLQFLKGNFKHVVVDSPPAISFTDAAILSTLVDGVVLVAMAGKSSIHLMRRFKQRLSTIGARIYGVVLNGIKPNTLEYGYYGYGYTYSYYDSPDDDETTPRMEEDVVVETSKN
jgi:capsular exopolysaccharide synthesis family protein